MTIDLLLVSCSVDLAELDRVSEKCRAQGKPLGLLFAVLCDDRAALAAATALHLACA